jgi:pyruvate dehydrogenase E2 component (dihydrolipoamide acetyltransferase)
MTVGPPRVHALGGAGEPVVLVHGFASDRLSWLGNQHDLARVAAVHALDLPGHGDEPMRGTGSVPDLAAAVVEAIAAAGLGPVHIVGHSLGGGVAVAAAAAAPELVRSLALIAPAGLGAAVDTGFLDDLPEATSAEAVEPLLHALVSRPRLINRHMVARVLAQLSDPGRRDALRAIANGLRFADHDLHDAVAAVATSDLPRLVIWGGADRTNPLDPDRLAAFGGERMILEASAHLPHVEEARAVNERLGAFLAGQGRR